MVRSSLGAEDRKEQRQTRASRKMAQKRPTVSVQRLSGVEGIPVNPPSPKRKIRPKKATLANQKRVNSNRKGKVGERQAVKLWREFYPGCKRSFGQARKGYEQPDIIGGGVEVEWFIEVKRPNKFPNPIQLSKWMNKALDDAMKFQESDPYGVVLMVRPNRQEWHIWYRKDDNHEWVSYSWEDFCILNLRAGTPDPT